MTYPDYPGANEKLRKTQKDKPPILKCTGKKSVCGMNIQFTGRGIFSCVYYDNSKEGCTCEE